MPALKMPAFLVTGATGRQGGSTARALLSNGAKVHALVRNPKSNAAIELESLGVEIFAGHYGDADAVAKALEGVVGVFFVPPNPEPGYVQACSTFIRTCAARREILESFVLSSAAGTEWHRTRVLTEPDYGFAVDWSWRADLEDEAKASGFKALTILRCSFLFPNYLLPAAPYIFPQLGTEHKLVTTLKPDTKIPHMNPEDMGAWAAPALMESPPWKGQQVNLATHNLTAKEAADIISGCSGVEIGAITDFQGDDVLSIDTPMMRYYRWATELDASIDVTLLRKKYGVRMTTLKEFLEANADELRKSLNITA